MREVTAKEFYEAFEDKLVKVEAPEHYGISIDMDKAKIEYYEDSHEISFTAGNYDTDGIGTVTLNLDDAIDCIEVDDKENEPVYYISFVGYMADIVVTLYKSYEEIKAEQKKKN